MSSHSSTSIIKFADDTVVLGLISNNDETAYLDEVERHTSYTHIQTDNLLKQPDHLQTHSQINYRHTDRSTTDTHSQIIYRHTQIHYRYTIRLSTDTKTDHLRHAQINYRHTQSDHLRTHTHTHTHTDQLQTHTDRSSTDPHQQLTVNDLLYVLKYLSICS